MTVGGDSHPGRNVVHVLEDVVALRELQRAAEEGRDLLAGKQVLERIAGQDRPRRQEPRAG